MARIEEDARPAPAEAAGADAAAVVAVAARGAVRPSAPAHDRLWAGDVELDAVRACRAVPGAARACRAVPGGVRVCAPVCGGARDCAPVCGGVRGCAPVCGGARDCAPAFGARHGWVDSALAARWRVVPARPHGAGCRASGAADAAAGG